MTKFGLTTILLFLILVSLNSCKKTNNEEKAKEDITAFATAYFNWDFPNASRYAHGDTKEWLTFLASQISENDIQVIKDKEDAATIEVDNIDFDSTTSTAIATISVHDYLMMDSISKNPILCVQNQYIIEISKENGLWKCGKPKIKK